MLTLNKNQEINVFLKLFSVSFYVVSIDIYASLTDELYINNCVYMCINM